MTNTYLASNPASRIWGDDPGKTALQFNRWRKQSQSLDSIALSRAFMGSPTLTGTGRPEYLGAVSITAEYFDTLVRSTQRARELAVRVALGASRGDLIRLSLAESFLVSLAGTIAGWILSLWITSLASSRAPHLSRAEEIVTDTSVLWFAIGMCVLTTILFGALPALRSSQADPLDALRAGSRGVTEGLRGGRVRATLVAAEVALGVLLVVGSGLLLRSFHNVMNAPRGFDGHDILLSDLFLTPQNYRPVEKQSLFFRNLRDQLSLVPGVLQVAADTRPPLATEAILAVFEKGVTKAPNDLLSAGWPNVTAG